MSTRPSKTQHQARKATLLANVLAAHGATAAQAAALPDEGWATTAALACVSLPSDETRAMVVGIMESRESEQRRAAMRLVRDEFAGGVNVPALVA